MPQSRGVPQSGLLAQLLFLRSRSIRTRGIDFHQHFSYQRAYTRGSISESPGSPSYSLSSHVLSGEQAAPFAEDIPTLNESAPSSS